MIETRKKRTILVKKSFLTLIEDEVILPNQKETTRLFVSHPGASAILAFTPDQQLILTKQYRYPIAQISLEIPAGKKDEDEVSFLTCAKRELEEETGYTSTDFELLGTYYPCVGYSDEILYLYVARNCELMLDKKNQDNDEFVEPVLMDLKQVKALLFSFGFKDGKTIIALYHYFNQLAQKEIEMK